MTVSFSSKLLKTALAFSFTVWAGTATFAQGSKNPLRTSQSFTSIFSGAGTASAKVNALVSRPGNSQDFTATGPGSWQHIANSAYTYDNQGRLTQRLYTDPTTGQNQARILITYNAQGEEIEFKRDQWQGTNWETVDAYRSLITYNSVGKKQEIIFQNWNSNTNTWENESREQYTYDTNNLVADITNSEWDFGTWTFVERMVLNNTSGTAASLIIQEYTGGTWEDMLRAQNVTWHVLYDTPSAYILEYKDNGIWVNVERYNAIYDVNGGHVGVYEEWNPMTSTWDKMYRETETYDTNRNYTGWKDETWDPATTTWFIDGEEKELLTYSGIDITQRIFQDSWGSTTGTLQDREKEVYSNFQQFNVSGVKNALSELAVNVYPNPAQNQFTISMLTHKGNFTATLTDVTGKSWLTKNFKATEEKMVDIEMLPKGVYLLQLQTDAGSTVKRIVKQ